MPARVNRRQSKRSVFRVGGSDVTRGNALDQPLRVIDHLRTRRPGKRRRTLFIDIANGHNVDPFVSSKHRCMHAADVARSYNSHLQLFHIFLIVIRTDRMTSAYTRRSIFLATRPPSIQALSSVGSGDSVRIPSNRSVATRASFARPNGSRSQYSGLKISTLAIPSYPI